MLNFRKTIQLRGKLIFNIVIGIFALGLGLLGLIRGNHLAAIAMGFVFISNIIQIFREYLNIKKSKAQED